MQTNARLIFEKGYLVIDKISTPNNNENENAHNYGKIQVLQQ